jgi:LysM repeat protein
MDFLEDKQQVEMVKTEDFKLEELPVPQPQQAEKPVRAKKDAPKIKVQSIDEEKTARAASEEQKRAAAKTEQPAKAESAVAAKQAQPAKEAVPKTDIIEQGSGTKDVVAKAGVGNEAEIIGTSARSDAKPVAQTAEKAETPLADDAKIAAIAVPAEVVKDAPAPIEVKRQADSATAGVEAMKNPVEVSEAEKEPAPEKASAPAGEPGQKKEAEKVAAIKPDDVKASKLPEPMIEKKNQQIRKTTTKSPPNMSQKKGKKAAPKYHVIASGDTLMSLARKYNTDADKLRKLNGLYDESILKVGSKLRVN